MNASLKMNRNLNYLSKKLLYQTKLCRNYESSAVVWDASTENPEKDEQFLARLRKLIFGEKGNKKEKLENKEEERDEDQEDDD